MKRAIALIAGLLLVSSVADAKRRPPPKKAPAAAAAAPGAPAAVSPAAKAAAKQHYAAAEALFKEQKYEEAIKEYRAAYDSWPLDGFNFNIAQCYRNLGRTDDAIAYFEKYLAAPNIKNRPEVEAVLAELRQNKDGGDASAAKVDPAATPAVAKVEPTPVEKKPEPVVAVTPPVEPASVENKPEAPPAAATTPPKSEPADGSTPVWKKGWFWGVTAGALVVVAGGVTGAAVGSTQLPSGTLGTVDWRP